MYIDIRGNWPVLVDGSKTFELIGVTKGVTLDEALRLRESYRPTEAKRNLIDHYNRLIRFYQDLLKFWCHPERRSTHSPIYIKFNVDHCEMLIMEHQRLRNQTILIFGGGIGHAETLQYSEVNNLQLQWYL